MAQPNRLTQGGSPDRIAQIFSQYYGGSGLGGGGSPTQSTLGQLGQNTGFSSYANQTAQQAVAPPPAQSNPLTGAGANTNPFTGGTSGIGTSGGGVGMGGIGAANVAAGGGSGGVGAFGVAPNADPWAGQPPSSPFGGQTHKPTGPYPDRESSMSNDQADYYQGLMDKMKGNKPWEYDPALSGQDAHAWYLNGWAPGSVGQRGDGMWITTTGFGPNGEFAAFPGGMAPGQPGYEDFVKARAAMPAWGGNIQWAVNDERYKELFDALRDDPNLMNSLIADPLNPVWSHFSTPQLMEASATYNATYPAAGVPAAAAAAAAPAYAEPAYVAPVDYGSRPGDRTNSGPGGGRDTGKGDGGRDGGRDGKKR
jgi:hypothetical protein